MMNDIKDAIQFNFDSETASHAITTALVQSGLSAVRSFDLRSALTTHDHCECPYHGSAKCNCQYRVLLVYGAFAEPVASTLHTRDQLTEIRIVHDATTCPDPQLGEQVRTALVSLALAAMGLQLTTTQCSPGIQAAFIGNSQVGTKVQANI